MSSTTKLSQPLEIIDISTGEKLNIRSASDQQIGKFLSDINLKLRKLKKLETGVKSFIKTEKGLEFKPEMSGGKEIETAYFADWRVRKTYQKRFSEDLLHQKGSPMEISLYESLKKKYSLMTEVVRFG
jgi:hypothetical protein